MDDKFELPDLKENEENVDTEHNQNKIQDMAAMLPHCSSPVRQWQAP